MMTTKLKLAALLATSVALSLAIAAPANADPERAQAQANFLKADVNKDEQLDLAEFTTFINLNADHNLGRAAMIRPRPAWRQFGPVYEGVLSLRQSNSWSGLGGSRQEERGCRQPAQQAAAARHMLGLVGLGDRIEYLPANLSGGQKQRVAIARALVSNPEIVFADEPTAALDKVSGMAVVELLKKLGTERGTTTVMVTHDPRILDLADRIITLEDGALARDTDAASSNRDLETARDAADLVEG